MRVVLFDVDRTLIVSPSGAHMGRFQDAISAVHGQEVIVDPQEIDGLTDRLILKLYCDKFKIFPYRFHEMFDAMAQSFKKTLPERKYKTLPGVEKLLQILDGFQANIGHVTGNIRSIALEKMKMAGIDKYFTFGGYGDSEHESRHELVSLALNELREMLVNPRTQKGKMLLIVYLLGDTPRDIAAGKKALAKTIGVATGTFSTHELQDAGADLAVTNFEKDLHKVLDFILQ